MKYFKLNFLSIFRAIFLAALALGNFTASAEDLNSKSNPSEAVLNAQTKLKNALTAVHEDMHFTLVVSNGNNPQDFDVMITRRAGNFYSFKYCRAHNADGSPNEIALIRQLHLAYPGYFKKWTKERKNIISGYFESPNCSFVGNSQIYASVTHYKPKLDSQESWGGPGVSGISGVVSAVTGIVTIGELIDMKRQTNTLSYSKIIFAKNSPWPFGVVSIALLGVSVKSAMLWHKDVKANDASKSTYDAENAKLNEFARATYEFNLDRQSNTQSSLDGQIEVESMKTFNESFTAGLNLLLKTNSFRRL